MKSEYRYDLLKEKFDVNCKDKDKYNKLNRISCRQGVSLKLALEKRIFTLNGNRMYFRGKSMIPVENTVFHIIGNMGIMMGKIPPICRDFFSGLQIKESSMEKKLLLLKTLLQASGWCEVRIIHDSVKIKMDITNLPVGLQKESDNWVFIERFIEGYLHTLGSEFHLLDSKRSERGLRMTFAR